MLSYYKTPNITYKGIILVSTEMLTRPSSPSRPVHTETISRDIPEQLAAYSAQALSTALLMLGTHFAAG